MNANLENMRNKRVLIVGLGRSGIAALQAMLRLQAVVSIQDSKKEDAVDPQLVTYLRNKGVTCYFDHTPADMSQFDMLILSPGVSPELPFIEEARRAGVCWIGVCGKPSYRSAGPRRSALRPVQLPDRYILKREAPS